MSFGSNLYRTMRITTATHQLLVAGATLFFTVRMVIDWDKPTQIRTFPKRKRS
jgi:hypothetical protein